MNNLTVPPSYTQESRENSLRTKNGMVPKLNIRNIHNSSEWNRKLEKSIQSLGELALAYKWMHCEAATDFSLIYNRIMYGSIILGPMAGVLNTVNTYIGDVMFIPILVTIISFISGILIGIMKFSDYEEKITQYKSTAAKYTSLANNARIQLNLERKDREDAKQYMIWYATSYGNLFEASPIIPSNIMDRYKKHAKTNNFKVPGEVGILLDVDDDEKTERELNELSELDLSIKNLENKFDTLLDTACDSKIRLKMFGMGSARHTDFNRTDLMAFNQLMMKRKVASTSSTVTPHESWRDNLPDDNSMV